MSLFFEDSPFSCKYSILIVHGTRFYNEQTNDLKRNEFLVLGIHFFVHKLRLIDAKYWFWVRADGCDFRAYSDLVQADMDGLRAYSQLFQALRHLLGELPHQKATIPKDCGGYFLL